MHSNHPDVSTHDRSVIVWTVAFSIVVAGTLAIGGWHVLTLQERPEQLEAAKTILAFLAFLTLVYAIYRQRVRQSCRQAEEGRPQDTC